MRPFHLVFAYTDGEAVEHRLLTALRRCNDVSASSVELLSTITDWPSEYHFSPVRHNLLRPFPFKPSDRILELGCGCGAMTRYLGETGATVVAVEGSRQRATIAAERCRDLPNVRIFCDNIADFSAEASFDYVTLIGVLEYSPLFINGDDPVQSCLEKARSFLAVGGRLIIAIENQLGLKYFAGSEEDHVVTPLFGIHGLYNAKTPVTFGRHALQKRLDKAGMAHAQFYYPFPDYKLPSVVLSEAALNHPNLHIADLLARAMSGTRSGRYRLINENLAWQAVAENGLVADLANSFLVFAHPNEEASSPPDWLATFYSAKRRNVFWTETIIRPETRGLMVRKRLLTGSSANPGNDAPFVQCLEDSSYVDGQLWVTGLWRLLAGDAAPDAVTAWMRPWLDFLRSHSVGGNTDASSLDFLLPENFVDCTPFNLVRRKGGEFAYIDAEWRSQEPITASWVVIRGLFFSIENYPIPASRATSVASKLIAELLESCGVRLTQADWTTFSAWEGRIQTYVHEPSSLKRFDRTIDRQLGDLSPILIRFQDYECVSKEALTLGTRLDEIPEVVRRVTSRSMRMVAGAVGVFRRIKRIPSLSIVVLGALVWRKDRTNLIRSGIRIAITRGTLGLRQGLQALVNGSLTYDRWVALHDTLGDEDSAAIRLHVTALPRRPLISVLLSTRDTPQVWLRKAIDSVRAQLYPHWELCIADDASTATHVHVLLRKYAMLDERIRLVFREGKGGVAAASNSSLKIAQGEFIAVLDDEDQLSPHALYLVAVALAEKPDLDMIYSDEDKIDEQGRRFAHRFKPDWNPDLLSGQDIVSHLVVYRATLVRSLGGFREGYEGSQDWDLAIRASEAIPVRHIHHIPCILYHGRAVIGSSAADPGETSCATKATEAMLRDHLQRTGCNGRVCRSAGGLLRIRYPIPSPPPLVSIIIPTRNSLHLLRRCIDSLRERSTYSPYEVVVVNNQSDDPATLDYLRQIEQAGLARVIPYDLPFNYSAINNAAAKEARGSYLCLMNNDIEVISGDWLEEMVGHASRSNIGAVGAMLYYPDDTIQHAGVLVGRHGCADHLYADSPRGTTGYMGRAALVQNLSAVTAACLVVRRAIFEEIGGFDEVNLPVAFNDVDFCLRLIERGYRNLWTPFAELYHHESASRGHDDTPDKQQRSRCEVAYMQKRWGHVLDSDPAHNPNLSLDSSWPTISPTPRTKKPWHP